MEGAPVVKRFEVRGCRNDGDNTATSWPLVDGDDDAEWFGVYANLPNGEQEIVADFYLSSDASAFADWMEAMPPFIVNPTIVIDPVIGDGQTVRLPSSAPWVQEDLRGTAGLACAECGTTTAKGYVVTILDPENATETKTEVCRECHDKLNERCTCARDGNARRCPHHTQADFDAAEREREHAHDYGYYEEN